VGLKPKVGDLIVTQSSAFTEGMSVEIWGLIPRLPRWVKSKWFTDLDRNIVGWICSKLGRLEQGIRGTVVISRIDRKENTLWLS
jgi:hypothetical protein